MFLHIFCKSKYLLVLSPCRLFQLDVDNLFLKLPIFVYQAGSKKNVESGHHFASPAFKLCLPGSILKRVTRNCSINDCIIAAKC